MGYVGLWMGGEEGAVGKNVPVGWREGAVIRYEWEGVVKKRRIWRN